MSSTHMHIEPAPEKGFFDSILPRQVEPSGVIGWLTTIDHKRIGILYLITALWWFLVGGLEAMMIRWQLHKPEYQDFISAETYNALFTMHGTTMIFMVIMPLAVAFFNYIMPLQIGARDVAFPRLNAFSYWMFFFGSVLINVSWLFGEAPNMTWVGYSPLTNSTYTPGMSGDFWVVGLQILGVSSIVGALNFITTIINMRAPGMSFMRLPVFTWMTLITALLVILAFPAITICLVELMFDRLFHTNFFEASAGGLPILWQHLFWVFGHPEVYILILPPMGMVSEILPVFSRKPLFGYPLIVGSGAAIGFMGFTVWTHHMFTSGLGNIATAAFALTTMAIAVPTGVKIFNWIGTLYRGQLIMATPMLFALGFIYQFMMGGFSGLMHANAVHDLQQHDSYFVVAHFHYVLIGGALFGTFAGIYYWFPAVTGRKLNEAKGKFVFWFLFIGFNGAFFPMHWLGLNGMPRRIYTYSARNDWGDLNFVVTCGAALMAVAVIIFFYDLFNTAIRGELAGRDPWDARTLEWSIPNPPPVYNFKETPHVHSLDDWWYTKYPDTLHHDDIGLDSTESPYEDDDASHMHPSDHVVDHGHHDEHGIHMPGGSWFPMFAAFGFFVGGMGLVFNGQFLYGDVIEIVKNGANVSEWVRYDQMATHGYEVPYLQTLFWRFWIAIAGGLFGVFSIFCWSMEPIGGYNIHFDDEDDGVKAKDTKTPPVQTAPVEPAPVTDPVVPVKADDETEVVKVEEAEAEKPKKKKKKKKATKSDDKVETVTVGEVEEKVLDTPEPGEAAAKLDAEKEEESDDTNDDDSDKKEEK